MRTFGTVLLFVIASWPTAAGALPVAVVTGTTAVVTGQGVVTRPADSATINLALVSSDDASETAASKNNAAYDGLLAKVGPLGVGPNDVKTTYYNLVFNPRPADARPPTAQPVYPYQPRFGYVVTRQLLLTVSNGSNVGKIVDAAIASGVTNINGISYGLGDRASANEAALAAAIENAATQARAVAAASHMRIVGIKQIQVNNGGNPMPMPVRYPMATGQPVATQIPPATVDVRATVTVTYELK